MLTEEQKSSVQADVDAALAAGNWDKAVTQLTDLVESSDDDWAAIKLRDIRFTSGDWNAHKPAPTAPCPPEAPDMWEGQTGIIPEIDMNDLGIETVASAMRHHGALIVRNFFDEETCADLRGEIDRVFEKWQGLRTVEDTQNATPTGQFAPLPKTNGSVTHFDSSFLEDSSAAWTVLAPTVMAKLLRLFNQRGLKALLTDYFSEEPQVSFKKWVLRRMTPLIFPADWHQDGAFMGSDIKSLNLWVALSECGSDTDAPGMTLVPKRLHEVLPTGQNGAIFDWSVSHLTVEEEFADTPPVTPHFRAGDAVFFDHFNLHVTSYSPTLTDERYAVETWFFGSQTYSVSQAPVRW